MGKSTFRRGTSTARSLPTCIGRAARGADDQDAYDTNVTFTNWHTAVIEWLGLPTRCTFILGGRVIGQSTSRIPNTPMRWVIQNGVRFDTPNPDNATQGHVYID
jgi:hypothetical protein